MTTATDSPLAAFSLKEIATELEHRGFGPEHVLDVSEVVGWTMEHPVSCRLGQLKDGVMRTLWEACPWSPLLEAGLADYVLESQGAGRYSFWLPQLDEYREEFGLD